MRRKLTDIVSDLNESDTQQGLFARDVKRGEIRLHRGSCLDLLPKLRSSSYDCIVTSPPYCNRYDYTRTYALELALLGVDEDGLVDFRQKMLSCTVENRAKDLMGLSQTWAPAITAAERQEILQMVLRYLEDQKERSLLKSPAFRAWSEGISTRWPV